MFRRLGRLSEDVDVLSLYLADSRAVAGRPWMMFNMVVSVDGATAIHGGSTALNDEDDKRLFAVLRTIPDVILVGAATVRAEDYGPVMLDETRRAIRLERGQSAAPVLAIVSGRLNLDPESKVFSNSEYRPMIITSTDADPGRLAMLGDAAEVVFLPELTPQGIVQHLGAASVVLCEGGPTLNGQFVRAGLVDELNLTVSPKLVSGDSARMAGGAEAMPPLEMRLDRVLSGDRALFLRYLRHTTVKEVDHG